MLRFCPVLTKSFIVGLEPKQTFAYYPVPGPAYVFFVVMFLSLIIAAQYIIIKNFKTLPGIVKNQLKYVLVASTLGFLGGATTFPLVYDIPLPPVGGPLVFIYTVVITLAILRYRLLDINIAITRAGVFAAVYTLVLGTPFIAGYILQNRGLWYIPLTIGIILASSGPFLYTRLQRKAENRLRKEEFAAHEALNDLVQNMMRFTNLNTLLKLIVHYIVKIMKVDSASIYLREENNGRYLLRASWSMRSGRVQQGEFTEESPLIQGVLLRRVPIISEELRFSQDPHQSIQIKELQQELHNLQAAVVIPALKGESLFGFLMLGQRKGNRLFSQEDLNLLLVLANQAVLAIENARLFEREKHYLAEKSRKDALADMAPGVSHQFNNRFMAINSEIQACLDLLNQRPLEDLSKEEMVDLFKNFKEFGALIIEDTVKGREIAQAVLRKGKADIRFVKAELGGIIKGSIKLLKLSRTRASLEGTPEPEVVLEIDQDLPEIIVNPSLMEDVFYNLVDNARDAIIAKHKYIKENKLPQEREPYKGRIRISAKRQKDRIIITVEDNGIGVKEEHMKRLFSPYFTSKATAHKGTGMGLYVIEGFIEQHKGKISAESEYAKGTTFTIQLPVRTKDEENAQETFNHR